MSSDDEAEVAAREAILAAGSDAAEQKRGVDREWRAESHSLAAPAGAAAATASAPPREEVEAAGAGASGGWAQTVARKRVAATASEAEATSAAAVGTGGWAATQSRKKAEAAAKAAAPAVKVTPGISSRGLHDGYMSWYQMLVYLVLFVWVAWSVRFLWDIRDIE